MVRSKLLGALFCFRIISLTFSVARGGRVDVLLKYRAARRLDDSGMTLGSGRQALT